MKCVILAGGKGTRIEEESRLHPKPMVEIGGRPILWHIMKIYSSFGVNDFVVCLGYKGYIIKEYFGNYFLHQSDVTFEMARNEVLYHNCRSEPWKVTLVDTGEDTMTGGRLRRVRQYLEPGEPFCMTYGDSVSDVDVQREIEFHRRHGRKATVSCVRATARFGGMVIENDHIASFEQKSLSESGLINGGFFVLDQSVLDLIPGDDSIWEREPLETLAASGQLMPWVHRGFWQPLDTLRDAQMLNSLWESERAPWMLWGR